MKTQTYYHTAYEKDADICNISDRLCINCCGAVETPDKISTVSVRRDFYLMYMLDGNLDMELDDKSFTVCGGNLLIIAPGVKYHYTSQSAKTAYLWLHFTGCDALQTIRHFGLETNTVFDVRVHTAMLEKWERLFKEFIVNDSYFSDMCESILKEIFAAFSRYIKETTRPSLFRSIFYIHEHYFSDIKIPQLAAMENMSETKYRLLFNRITGISPAQYIINRRMEAAAVLLEDSDKPIAEIAKTVGYEDIYYFGRIFKNKTGVSPGRFRRTHTHNAR